MNPRELQGVVATDKHEQDAYVTPRRVARPSDHLSETTDESGPALE